jgi:hypothetical protein
LLSFRGISTPSLPAQGEQRRSSNFNIRRGNPRSDCGMRREAGASGHIAAMGGRVLASVNRCDYLVGGYTFNIALSRRLMDMAGPTTS